MLVRKEMFGIVSVNGVFQVLLIGVLMIMRVMIKQNLNADSVDIMTPTTSAMLVAILLITAFKKGTVNQPLKNQPLENSLPQRHNNLETAIMLLVQKNYDKTVKQWLKQQLKTLDRERIMRKML